MSCSPSILYINILQWSVIEVSLHTNLTEVIVAASSNILYFPSRHHRTLLTGLLCKLALNEIQYLCDR